MVNTWRNVAPEPLVRNPLAVCDVRTVGLEELVANRLVRQPQPQPQLSRDVSSTGFAVHSFIHFFFFFFFFFFC
jgi:hypothetical protein